VPKDLNAFLNEVDPASSSEFDNLLSATVLTTFGELKELFLRAVREFKDRDPGDRTSNNLVADLVREWRRQEQPAIRLGSYKNRFWIDGDRNDFPTVQEPFLEFFVLVYLLAEVGANLDLKEVNLVREVAWRLIEEEPLRRSER